MVNAIKSKVTDKVRFIEYDLFKADFSEATVISLYLYTWVNLRLRPKFLRQLKPGTRIVAHDFGMKEWKPDKTIKIEPKKDDHTIFFWIVPANVIGVWEWFMPAGLGKKRYEMKLEQMFQTVAGTVKTDTSEKHTNIKDVKLKGDILQFIVDQMEDGQSIKLNFEGKVFGDDIEGVVISNGGSMPGKFSWKAKRDPSTITQTDCLQ